MKKNQRYVKIKAVLDSLAPAIPVTRILGYFFERSKQRLSKKTIFGLVTNTACPQGVNSIDYSNLSFCLTLYLFVLLCHNF